MLSERKTVPVRSEAHFIIYMNTVTYWQSSDSCDSESQITPTSSWRGRRRKLMGKKIKHLKCWKCVLCLLLETMVKWSIQALTSGISTLESCSLYEQESLWMRVSLLWIPSICDKIHSVQRQHFNIYQYYRKHIEVNFFISCNGRRPIDKSATSVFLFPE